MLRHEITARGPQSGLLYGQMILYVNCLNETIAVVFNTCELFLPHAEN